MSVYKYFKSNEKKNSKNKSGNTLLHKFQQMHIKISCNKQINRYTYYMNLWGKISVPVYVGIFLT